MVCPACNLRNPPRAMRCDCGYDFASGEVQRSYLPPKRPHAGAGGGGLMIAGLGFIVAGIGLTAATGGRYLFTGLIVAGVFALMNGVRRGLH